MSTAARGPADGVDCVRLRVSYKGRFVQASVAPPPAALFVGCLARRRRLRRRLRPPFRAPPSTRRRNLPALLACLLQGEGGGAWRYLGGDHFLESLPEATRYADLMFALSEKVDGAVSVKYLLPGEELDPEALISVNDDGDVKVGGRAGGRRVLRASCPAEPSN